MTPLPCCTAPTNSILQFNYQIWHIHGYPRPDVQDLGAVVTANKRLSRSTDAITDTKNNTKSQGHVVKNFQLTLIKNKIEIVEKSESPLIINSVVPFCQVSLLI